jgi:hypothetical protein
MTERVQGTRQHQRNYREWQLQRQPGQEGRLSGQVVGQRARHDQLLQMLLNGKPERRQQCEQSRRLSRRRGCATHAVA